MSKWLQISKHTCWGGNEIAQWHIVSKITYTIVGMRNALKFDLLDSSRLKDHMYTKSVQCITHILLARNYWNIGLKTATMDQYDRSRSIPFHFSSYVRSGKKDKAKHQKKNRVLIDSTAAKKRNVSLTTSLFVTLAATIPNVMMYNDGCVSNNRSTDFCEIMNALKTTASNGITGDITLVPWHICLVFVSFVGVEKGGKYKQHID